MTSWVRLALATCALVFGFALGALVGVSSAFAQPAVAQKAMVEGDALGRAGKWDEALAAYQKAHTAQASAATETRIANALYKLGRITEAADAYDDLLAQRGASLLGGEKKLATERQAELAGKTGTVALRVSEGGATISVDDKAAGTSPLAKPLRVLSGSRKVVVTKDGFAPFSTQVEVAAKAAVTLDVQLKPQAKGGKVSVTVKGGESMTVSVDGADVGPAPWEGVLAPGPHTIGGRSPTKIAAPVSIEVKDGVDAAVELVPGDAVGTLEVRALPEEAQVSVDGQPAAKAPLRVEVAEGEHEITVTLDGYETVKKKVKVGAGEVFVETISLRKATAGAVVEKIEKPWSFNGLYGGVQLIGMFEPAGSGNTLETSCDVTGATSCESGTPMGGGLGGFIGWAFAPIGLELFILGAGDAVFPKASFDGTTGSEINPLVASPAREEEFVIARFGGGGAARIRLLFPIDRFRITGAIGAGLAYRHMLLGRDTTAENGATSSVGAEGGEGYLSGVLSIDLGGQVLIAGTTSFMLGASLWLEHAGDGVPTAARDDILLTKDGEIPAPQATPSYDMAAGTQVFIGPYVGFQFGP